MKTKRLKLIAVSTAAFMAVSGATVAWAKLPPATNEFQTVNLKFNTKKLGKSKKGKVAQMTVTTGTGIGAPSQPNPDYSGVPDPAVRALVYFDKSIKTNLKGIPICDETAVQGLNTLAARAACPTAIVGSGQAAVRIPNISEGPNSAYNTGQATVNGKTIAGETQATVTAFKTTKAGKYDRLILFSRVGATAVGSALIGTLKPAPKALKKKGYGTLLDVEIPPLALGAALTRFSLTVGGTSWPAYTEASPGPYTAKVSNSKAKNFIKASCPKRKLKLTSEFQFTTEGTPAPEVQLPATSTPFKCR